MKWVYDRLTAVLLGLCYLFPLYFINKGVLEAESLWGADTSILFKLFCSSMFVISVISSLVAVLLVLVEISSPRIVTNYLKTFNDRIIFCFYAVGLGSFTLIVGYVFLPVIVILLGALIVFAAISLRNFLLEDLSNPSPDTDPFLSIFDEVD